MTTGLTSFKKLALDHLSHFPIIAIKRNVVLLYKVCFILLTEYELMVLVNHCTKSDVQDLASQQPPEN